MRIFTTVRNGLAYVLIGLLHSVNAQKPLLVLPVGHTYNVVSARFSPDGRRILSASEDNTAKIWDALTGNLLADLKLNINTVNSAEFSPDGKKIVIASADESASVWDSETGKLDFILRGHKNKVTSAIFSDDGKKILTVSDDNTAKIWDAATGKLLLSLEGHTARLNTGQFSIDGAKVLTSSDDHTARIWDAVTGKSIMVLKKHELEVITAQFSPDGTRIITASTDKTTRIWDAASGKLLANIKVYTSVVTWAQFSPDSKKVIVINKNTAKIRDATTGALLVDLKGTTNDFGISQYNKDGSRIITINNNVVKIWDPATGNLLADLSGHEEKIRSARYSPDNKKIVTSSDDKTIKIWDAATGAMLLDLRGHTSMIYSAQFSPDGKKFITASRNEYHAKVWDVTTGNLLYNLSGYPSIAIISFAQFSPDGEKIVTASISLDLTTKIWDANTGGLLMNLKGHTSWVNYAQFSPDGKRVVTASNDHTAIIWNAETGAIIRRLSVQKIAINGDIIPTPTSHGGPIQSAVFSPDGKKIITASSDGTAKIWDANTGEMLLNLSGHYLDVKYAQFSPDGKKVITASYDNTAKVWDAITGAMLLDLTAHSSAVTSAQFSPDGKRIITASWDQTLKVWDAETGKLLADMKEHTLDIHSAQYSPDGKRIATGSSDNTAKVWDAQKNCLQYSFLSIDSADYLVMLPSGYYKCTSNAARLLHYVNKELKVISFEQLDIKYNRPDKVLEAMGCADSALIQSYRKAYNKRIKKLGIDTTAFREGYSVPEADFTNRREISYEQVNGNLELRIHGMDSIYKIDRINIWVNEVPIWGLKGKSVRAKNSNIFDTTITILLSNGENRIETSITNANGIESYRMPLAIKYTPEKPRKEMIYFIGIGIDRFANPSYNLSYSTKDIRDLCVKLKEKYKESIVIDTLFNSQVSVANVKALKQRLLKTTVNDKVIVSYSGHGLLSRDFDYYLSTYTVNFSRPEENGLPYDELEHLLDSIPARKKLMLIDACHSGEVDKDEEFAMNRKADSLGLAKTKGSQLLVENHEQRVGLKNSFELMQSLFVNVGKNTGTVIISAAAGNEYALESSKWNNGVFTYSILEALQNYPTMKISELKKVVSARVEELTNGLQKPTYRNETIAVDWSIW
jgi:WD40 repeat protein